MKLWVLIFSVVAFCGCATAPPPSPTDQKPVPLKEANLEMVFEENEGLEINAEDAKEVRDFYRAGVQKKALAEKREAEKAYSEALRLYQESCYLFSRVLRYIEEDAAEFPCFEGTSILFFPNLLSADNHLKMGKIQKSLGRENPAQRNWKKALDFARLSLRFERTEWGLALQQEILSLLPEKR
jgi:tetratricopeptide (TPR) repeat protein